LIRRCRARADRSQDAQPGCAMGRDLGAARPNSLSSPPACPACQEAACKTSGDSVERRGGPVTPPSPVPGSFAREDEHAGFPPVVRKATRSLKITYKPSVTFRGTAASARPRLVRDPPKIRSEPVCSSGRQARSIADWSQVTWSHWSHAQNASWAKCGYGFEKRVFDISCFRV
jgi:hypothetical protein